jgi:hypothetical protein
MASEPNLWKKVKFTAPWMGVAKGTTAYVCKNTRWEKEGFLVPNCVILLTDRLLWLRRESLKQYVAPAEEGAKERPKCDDLLKQLRKASKR